MLNRLNGLHYPQEYLCLSNGTFDQPLHAYIISNGLIFQDITYRHCFIGYHPVIFALSSSQTLSPYPEEITIAFSNKILSQNGGFNPKDAVASLIFKKIKAIAGDGPVAFYEASKGQHRFISSFHQFVIQLHNHLYQKKPGNVFLGGNLLKQVQIAYSLPRNISLITVGQNDQFNLFPTDLHGPIDKDRYIISLRHEGKASRQVVDANRILLTEVHSNLYKTVYSLGKNHMQELKAKGKHPFSGMVSDNLQLPIPQMPLRYRELELEESFVHGIHRVMNFKVLYEKKIQDISASLAHIHNTYATWRQNNQLSGNYLLR